jgi:putative oxidoreductase
MAGSSITSFLAWARSAGDERHTIVVRALAGLILLGIGFAHIFVDTAPMLPLVEEAGFPFPEVLAPLSVAAEIVAGLSLLLGAYARLGGLIAIPVMAGALYSHLVIDVWPNGAENEPPILLPVVTAILAAYIVYRGAGRWSLDARM